MKIVSKLFLKKLAFEFFAYAPLTLPEKLNMVCHTRLVKYFYYWF